jgi:integrase
MKGRPITTEEFERMLLAVDKVILKQEMCKPRKEWKTDYAKTDEWKLLLKGLYWSGLRLREAVNLHWTDANKLCVVNLLSGAPMLHIPAELDKGNEDRIMPMAPEFAELLKTIPEGDRRGFVFNPQPTRQRYSARLAQKRVGEILSKIGQTANVVVQKPSNGKVKFASAHDLRRSFGERWSMLVMPQVLKDLMRHENIQTTMRYYIGQNARLTSSVIWEAYNAATSSSYEGSLREEQ